MSHIQLKGLMYIAYVPNMTEGVNAHCLCPEGVNVHCLYVPYTTEGVIVHSLCPIYD